MDGPNSRATGEKAWHSCYSVAQTLKNLNTDVSSPLLSTSNEDDWIRVQIQKDIISDLTRENLFCQKRYGSLRDLSLEIDL